ncbi:oxidoreductase [Paenibacillus sambharensis]|uniref:Oxidoreductase n=1 Tax=Paenibacillus sambharensis TaxID=1803190 RepID=A0A2W1LNK7_9BACL|nr:oxidoreductase [Paenibacillus sambharensis]PZD96064.1 oxidoreductase [Paenibacillus sambharensis]
MNNGNKQIRVGLIGYGLAGATFHAPVLTTIEGLKLVKVVERSGRGASQERYPWVQVVRQSNELYDDPEIDLVVITTPSTNHYSFAKEALEAGKHVVVEKPFTTTAEEAEELIMLAREKQLMLSVFHNRRWDGDFLTVRQIVKQQMLGRITSCEFRWDRYRPDVNKAKWRETDAAGAGIFYDLGVHFLDQALMLFGRPETIRGDIRVLREGGAADDFFDVSLGYPDGLNVRLTSSVLVREAGPRYALHGTEGSFVKYGIDPQEDALRAGLSPSAAGWGREAEANWGTLNATVGGLHVVGRVETAAGSYASYYRNVYEHLAYGAELEVKPEQAAATIQLIEHAFQSSREGRTIHLQG